MSESKNAEQEFKIGTENISKLTNDSTSVDCVVSFELKIKLTRVVMASGSFVIKYFKLVLTVGLSPPYSTRNFSFIN